MTLHLHVGLPKSGTTYLQSVLAANRPRLREAGWVYPFVGPEAMFRAAVELRGQEELWGLDAEGPGGTAGTWAALLGRCREVAAEGAPRAVVSHEILAGAAPDVVKRVLRDTDDLDLHLVVTARDLARQASAHWQEEVKNGRSWSFSDFEAALFTPAESAEQELGFWRSQDLLGVLRRWGSTLPPDHVHVVVCPRDAAAPGELWGRYAAALGLAPGVVDLGLVDRANESLGTVEIALLRRVLDALGGRLRGRDYAHVVKRHLAQRVLASRGGPRPVTPAPLAQRLAEVAQDWVEEIRGSGWQVYGDLSELVPAVPVGTPHPDEVEDAALAREAPEVLAELLLEIARLRAPAPAESDPPAPGPRQGLRSRFRPPRPSRPA